MGSGYPRQADIERAVKAARNCGISIGSIEITPSGEIKINDASTSPPKSDWRKRSGLYGAAT